MKDWSEMKKKDEELLDVKVQGRKHVRKELGALSNAAERWDKREDLNTSTKNP